MSRILLCYDCHVVHFPIQWHSDFRLSSMRRHRNCYYLSLLFHSFRLCQYLKRKHFQQLLYSYIEEIPKLQSHHHAMHISYRLDQSNICNSVTVYVSQNRNIYICYICVIRKKIFYIFRKDCLSIITPCFNISVPNATISSFPSPFISPTDTI